MKGTGMSSIAIEEEVFIPSLPLFARYKPVPFIT